MTVDVSSIEAAVRNLAMEKAQCLADAFVEEAQGRAPVLTGELVNSIAHDGVVDTGTSATATVTVGAEYGVYVEKGRGGMKGLLAVEVGGGVQVVTSVAPMQAQPFWRPAIEAWSSIVGACA